MRDCQFQGQVFGLGGLFVWFAKKQNVVSRSSCEFEYKALSNVVAKVKWFCNYFRELGERFKSAPIVSCDNK